MARDSSNSSTRSWPLSGNSRVAWTRIALLFPGPPIDIYGQVLTGVIGVAAGWRSLLIWVALLAAVAFIVQRRVAHGYDRQLHELDDIERDSPFQLFMATQYQQWKEPGD